MAALVSMLDEMLESWRGTRAGVIAEAANIPASRYDWRPTQESRSVAEQLRHILEVAMMATGEFTRPDTDLHRAPWPKLLGRYAKSAWRAKTKAQLLKLLRSQMRDAERRFRARGEIALWQTHRRFDGLAGTKRAWIEHAIAHEEYHRAQVALYARLMGLVPALTQRIAGLSR